MGLTYFRYRRPLQPPLALIGQSAAHGGMTFISASNCSIDPIHAGLLTSASIRVALTAASDVQNASSAADLL